jgi:hypothetical protein
MRMIIVILLVLTASVAFAQDGFQFNYQGRLLDGNGGVVPDGNYNMIFRVFSDSMAGTLLWEESHLAPISAGLFDIQLGSVNPCSLGVINSSQLYLETQVGDLPPLGSRVRLGESPRSGSTQRISGDIHTLPGLIRVFDPQPEPPGSACIVEVNSLNDLGVIRFFDPQPEPPGYAMKINLENGPDGGNFEFFAPQIGGAALANGNPQIKLRCNNIRSDFLLQRALGGGASPAESTGIYLCADSIRSYLAIYDSNQTQVKMGSASDAGYSVFYNDGSIYMGIEPSPFGGAIRMYDELENSSVEISSEGAARFLRDGSEYMGVEPTPWHAGGELTMYDSVGGQAMVFSSTGSASFIRDGSEYMGIEPVPWHSGGDLTMYDATGGQTLLLASNGMVSIGTGNHTNILTIRQYATADPIADAWTTYSSRRWKTNIQPLQGALDKVLRLQGVSYDEIEGGKHNIGLIAEDVGAVVPEVVAYEENGVDAKSVDYARLTALLIEAVKEQQQTIEQLKLEINELKIR